MVPNHDTRQIHTSTSHGIHTIQQIPKLGNTYWSRGELEIIQLIDMQRAHPLLAFTLFIPKLNDPEPSCNPCSARNQP